jgi:GT2 family glycosyltransferase
VTGLIVAASLDTEAQYIFEKHWSFNRGYVDKIYDQSFYGRTLPYGPPVWEIGAGANMAFRKSIFESVGLFDELLDVGAAGCNGDSEMWFRILSKGFSIRYNPRAITYHEHRKDLKGLKKQIFYYMRGFATAALIQQAYAPAADYKKHKLKKFPAYYMRLIVKEFPRFGLRLKTLRVEILGILSGIKYYKKNTGAKDIYPLVSVIIPCFNHGKYLKQAVKSIKRQKYPNIEIIVVDDGSSDNTQRVLKGMRGVKNILKSNGGLSAARNTGILNSTGGLLVFLDADDWLLENAIKTNFSYLQADAELAFVSGGHVKFFTESNETVVCEQLVGAEHYLHLLHGNYIGMHAAVMFRKWVFDHHLYDESLNACEDYDLYLRITRDFPVFHHTSKIAAYRIHNTNMSGNVELMRSSVLRVLKQQQGQLRTDEERRAYQSGINTFSEYYKI